MIGYYYGFSGKLGLWHWTMMFVETVCSPACQFLHQHPLKPLSYFNQMSQKVILPKIVTFSKAGVCCEKCCPVREERLHWKKKKKEKAGDTMDIWGYQGCWSLPGDGDCSIATQSIGFGTGLTQGETICLLPGARAGLSCTREHGETWVSGYFLQHSSGEKKREL